MELWGFARDRESGQWFYIGQPSFYHADIPQGYTRTGNVRYRKVRKQRNDFTSPNPKQSAFIAEYRIIEAPTEEEAWHLLLTFLKAKSETLSQ